MIVFATNMLGKRLENVGFIIVVELTPVSFRSADRYSRNKCMDGRAWFNALVLKTSVPLGTVGSNPTPYAFESA